MTLSRLTFCSALLAGLLTAPPGFGQTPSLDDLLRHPGDYSQNCDLRLTPFPAPIPGFRTVLHGEAGFSEKKLALIKKNRAALIPAIAAKLESYDLTRDPVPQPPDPSVPKNLVDANPVGADPAVFSTLLLNLIEEIDAVEVFPQLLALEAKQHAMLLAGEQDPKAPLPKADGVEGAGVGVSNLLQEGEEWDSLTPARRAEVERKTDLCLAQVVQRDILAVFVRSMRKQGYAPMLASDLEKTYGRLLKEKWAQHEDFAQYKTAASIPEDQRDSIKFDPIHKVAYMAWDPVEIPYSEATRRSIIDLTTAFCASRKK